MTRTSDDAIRLQLQGYQLATAEILYRMPDYPDILQAFVWQHHDIAPRFPVLRHFLGFWKENIHGKLHSVRVTRLGLWAPSGYQSVDAVFQIH